MRIRYFQDHVIFTNSTDKYMDDYAQIKLAGRTLEVYSFSVNDNNWASVRASRLIMGSEVKSQTNF